MVRAEGRPTGDRPATQEWRWQIVSQVNARVVAGVATRALGSTAAPHRHGPPTKRLRFFGVFWDESHAPRRDSAEKLNSPMRSPEAARDRVHTLPRPLTLRSPALLIRLTNRPICRLLLWAPSNPILRAARSSACWARGRLSIVMTAALRFRSRFIPARRMWSLPVRRSVCRSGRLRGRLWSEALEEFHHCRWTTTKPSAIQLGDAGSRRSWRRRSSVNGRAAEVLRRSQPRRRSQTTGVVWPNAL